jgi:hypothetical protein
MLDTGDNPDAPQPREMIDLEVSIYLRPYPKNFLNVFCLASIFILSVINLGYI